MVVAVLSRMRQTSRVLGQQTLPVLASVSEQVLYTVNAAISKWIWGDVHQPTHLQLAGVNRFPETDSSSNDALSLWDGILNAVPKRKTSYSKKRLRAAGKNLKPIQSFAVCPNCNKRHMNHHLCPWCFPFNNWTINKDKPRTRGYYEQEEQ